MRYGLPRALAALLLVVALTGYGASEEFPSHFVKLVVGGAAGGGVDIVARIIEPPMSQNLGQKVIVENRTGAGGFVGAAFVARAAPDGYTLLISTAGSITNALGAKINYNAERSFQPISRVMASPFFLVVPQDSKIKSVADLIAAGKDPKQVIRYGHPGPGTVTHLATALFAQMSGAHFEAIPYHSAAGQVNDTLTGQLQFGLLAAPDALSRRDQGLRVLAVSTAERSILAPDVPAIAEAGVPGYDTGVWHGLFAPAQTPRSVIERLHTALAAALQDDATKARFKSFGMIPSLDTPEAFAALIEAGKKRDVALAKELNLQAP
jgi:tripartite-type tricarboxylate transporter receptor subunit TctC